MPGSGAGARQNSKKHKTAQPEVGRRPVEDRNGHHKKPSGTETRQSIPLLVALASVFGMLLAVAAIGLSLLSVSQASKPTTIVVAAPDTNKSDPQSKGSASAPVVVTEWFDFQCPACRSYAQTRQPDFEKQYVDTGKVRFVSRMFSFLGPESYLAAEAAMAAGAQGYYWAFEDTLFQRQGAENSGAFSPDNLKKFAAELGLNQQAFNAALDQGTYRNAVMDQRREGEALGVNATPTFFVNDKKIQGVPTLDQWVTIINDASGSKP
jgi:protein-disulfide isomerase